MNTRKKPKLAAAPHEKMVQPQHAYDSNINALMARHSRMPAGSPIPTSREGQGQYIDMTILPQDFMTAQNLVLDMRRKFAAFPSVIRRRFLNDPYQLLRFVQDPSNLEEARKLGLVPPLPPGNQGDNPPPERSTEANT